MQSYFPIRIILSLVLVSAACNRFNDEGKKWFYVHLILTSNGLECGSNGVEPNRSWLVDTFPLRRGTDAFGGGATAKDIN